MTAAAPVTLVLVRHGETVGQSSIRYHGRTDVALSSLGRAQMEATREYLSVRPGLDRFAQVFASPLIRASAAARLIAGDKVSLITMAEFAEVDFGCFEGLTLEEIAERYPEEFRRWRRDPFAPEYTYPDGENRAAFHARVERGIALMLERIGNPREPATVLVVAHRGVLRTIVSRLCRAEPRVDLASIHILRRTTLWEPLVCDITDHLNGL